MKKIIYPITTILLVAAALSLSSCLKDSKYYVDLSKGVQLVELPLEARNLAGNLVPEALPISATPQVIQVAVNLASVNTLNSPLTVTLALDAPAVEAYNHANGLDTGGNVPYTMLPAADYSIPGYQVTIPAGQHLAYLNINVNTSLVDPSGLFILPIKIVNGGGQQISNYDELLLSVGAKNQYDGTYTASGVRHHPTLGDFPFSYSVAMGTTSANSIDGPALADLQEDLHLQINADNTVIVTSPTGQPSAANQAGTTSTYDPATKTFTLHYFYNIAAPRKIDETLVKQ
jgi:Domain of unknown function (DUF1735)/Domain of unknown function (DUF4361)